MSRFYALLATSVGLFLISFLFLPSRFDHLLSEAIVEIKEPTNNRTAVSGAELREWLASPECLAQAIADCDAGNNLPLDEMRRGIGRVERGTDLKISTLPEESADATSPETTRIKLSLTTHEKSLAPDLLEALIRQARERGKHISSSVDKESEEASEKMQQVAAALEEARQHEKEARQQLARAYEDPATLPSESDEAILPSATREEAARERNPLWDSLNHEMQQLISDCEAMRKEMTATHPLVLQSEHKISDLRERLLHTPQYLSEGEDSLLGNSDSSPSSDSSLETPPSRTPYDNMGDTSAQNNEALRSQWQRAAHALHQAEEVMQRAQEEEAAQAAKNQPLQITIVEPPRIVQRVGAPLSKSRLLLQGGIALAIGLFVAWRLGRPVGDAKIRSLESLQEVVPLPIVDAIDRTQKIRPAPGPSRLAQSTLRLSEFALLFILIAALIVAMKDRCFADEILTDPLTGLSHMSPVIYSIVESILS